MASGWFWTVGSWLGVALLVAGCGNTRRDATEAAINAAQIAVGTVAGEAEKYVPDQLAAANNALQSAKDALAKSDYNGALASARDAANKARELAATAAAKKQEWTQTWASLNESVPKSLDAVKIRLDAYSRRLPATMDPEQLEAAKNQYEQFKQTWSEASAAAAKGNLGGAIKKSSGLKDALAQLEELLGFKS